MSSRRNRGGGGGHGGGGEERWLLPYADMITLLLGLFIVLFAMSSIDAKKFDHVRRSLSQTFKGDVLQNPGDVLNGSSGVLNPEAANQSTDGSVVARLQQASDAQEARYEQQSQQIEQQATEAGLGNDTKVTNNQRGIVVSLAGDALFASGSSQLKPEVRAKLTKLERQLESFGREIEIAGHTDGAPYPHPGGNWRLSADRALSVVTFFLDQGYPPKLIKPAFYGDTRPVQAPPNGNPGASIAKNRRIEITILAPGADDPRSQAMKIADAARGPLGAGAARHHAGDPLEPSVDIIGEIAATSRSLQ